MIESLHLWIGAGLLALAVLAVLLLIATGGKAVPMSRRRPADAQSASALSRTADRATYLAGRALGDRAGSLEQSLDNAGLKATPQDFLVIVGSGMVALFALGLLVWGPIGGVLLLLAGPIVAMVVVSLRTSRRQRRFALQLDETLAILSGSLRAGYSLPQAAATVAAEAEAPTSEVFARVINEARVGRPFVEALDDAADRMQDADFFWIVQAIAINREVGGNLADVLEGVGETIRERTHLKRQVEALSSEGRLSAIILGALPFIVFFLLSLVNPAYIGRLTGSFGGFVLLGIAVVLLIAGLLWLRSAIKIKY